MSILTLRAGRLHTSRRWPRYSLRQVRVSRMEGSMGNCSGSTAPTPRRLAASANDCCGIDWW